MTSFRFAACSVLMFLNLALLTGCIAGATPMIKRERGPSGEQLAKNSFDPTTVQVGVSKRDEVVSRFKMVDTGLDQPRFFWGRWATSKWGYVVAAGGYGAAAGDAGRVWGIHNLLVTFDENGVTQTTQVLDDGKQLWQELRKETGKLPPIELTEPIAIHFDFYGAYSIRFAQDGIEVERPVGKIRTAKFPAQDVLRLSHTFANDKRAHPGSSCHVLHLREKTAVGKDIRFCADGSELFDIFRYLQRYAPEMIWE